MRARPARFENRHAHLRFSSLFPIRVFVSKNSLRPSELHPDTTYTINTSVRHKSWPRGVSWESFLFFFFFFFCYTVRRG